MTRRPWLVRGAAMFGLAVALASGGCGGDTEILVRVTRESSVPSPVPKLRVYAGVASGMKMGAAAVFVDQADPAADVDVSTRDLATDPYKLALRPSSSLPSGADLEVAALAFRVDSAGEIKPVGFGVIDHAISFADGQILSWDLPIAPVAGGIAVDTHGCIDFKIGDQAIHIAAQDDWDCDGDPHGTDCNDLDPAVNHMATEVCGNAVDEDCSGAIDDDTDADHDGVFACKGDCIDNPTAQLPGGLTAADVHAGATERLDNAIDENCDGSCDVGPLLDSDKDKYTTTGILTAPSVAGRCKKSSELVDCDDTDNHINPGATENPDNGIDDDCNGHCDTDVDGDTYTPSGYIDTPTMAHCPKIPNDRVDCDDDPSNDPTSGPKAKDIHPGATEICDGIDEDCDGKCDDDTDGDGYSVCGTVNASPGGVCTIITGQCGPNQQCDCAPMASVAHPVPPAGQPVPERCDGVDENCDGVLFPVDNGCFVAGPTTGSCFAGKRTCRDDGSTTPPWDACQPDLQQPVDPALCAAYDVCFADPSVADPFACAMRAPAVKVVSCTDRVTSGTTSCTPAQDMLPQLVSAGACAAATWQIAGGTKQGPWQVGFSTGAGTSDKAVGCTAVFEVDSFDHNLSTGTVTRILITQVLGTTAASVFLDLSPMASAVCTAGDGNLVCTGP